MRSRLLASAGVFEIPDGRSMIPETEAARLHRQLRMDEPDLAPGLASLAGVETANYILANRIPKPAQWALKALPARPAARILSRAIEKHSWTFAGSGIFRVLDPWTFEIENNPLVAEETNSGCLCHWHVAVFQQLYQALVARPCQCTETRCGAQSHGNTCHFSLHAGGS